MNVHEKRAQSRHAIA